jgi:hypothetical protein
VIDIPEQHQSVSAGLSNRRAVPAHCTQHTDTPSITNLVIRKLPNGVIELDPHVDRSCVIQLREDSARVIFEALREWL